VVASKLVCYIFPDFEIAACLAKRSFCLKMVSQRNGAYLGSNFERSDNA